MAVSSELMTNFVTELLVFFFFELLVFESSKKINLCTVFYYLILFYILFGLLLCSFSKVFKYKLSYVFMSY